MIILYVLYTLIVLIIMFGLLFRNYEVYNYRTHLLRHQITPSINDDALNKRDSLWRIVEFRKVSYNQMMYKFWVPLENFYPDKSFLYPGPEPLDTTTKGVLK